MSKRKKWALDMAERAGWTAVQVIAAGLTVEALDLPPAWVPVGAVLLSALKSWVARNVGKDDSASTVPGV
jgi:hypothetical protein